MVEARRKPAFSPRTAPWRIRTERGAAHVASGEEIAGHPIWRSCFAHLRKDSRYYELVERTLPEGYDYRYLVLEDESGAVRAIQPFFILDQDVLAGSGPKVRGMAGRLRRLAPRLLKLRTLMVGCTAGEGHLPFATPEAARWTADNLHAALKAYARHVGAGMVVLKEFPAAYREPLQRFAEDGYVRVPSMPATRLNIDYPSFDAYLAGALSKATRKDLRRKFRRVAEAEPITLEVVDDLTPYVDEVYPLYLQVYERASLKFEQLTPDYFRELGRALPDKARFFLWRQSGRVIAFSVCLLQGDEIWDEYIGLDYAVALDLNLYFYTFRDIVTWAIEHGCKWYASTALSYEPKLHLGSELMPLDLYVAHTSRVVNRALRFVLPFIEPTRNDKTLRRFPNFAELKG